MVADKLAGMAGFSDDSSTLAAAEVPRSTVIPADSSSGIWTRTVLTLRGLSVRLIDLRLVNAFKASTSKSIIPVLVRFRSTREEVSLYKSIANSFLRKKFPHKSSKRYFYFICLIFDISNRCANLL